MCAILDKPFMPDYLHEKDTGRLPVLISLAMKHGTIIQLCRMNLPSAHYIHSFNPGKLEKINELIHRKLKIGTFLPCIFLQNILKVPINPSGAFAAILEKWRPKQDPNSNHTVKKNYFLILF